MQLDVVLTPDSAENVQDAIVRAWGRRFGESPSPEVLALLMTLADFETATFEKIRHHNLGNIVISDETQDFYKLSGPHRYRVYSDLDDGAFGFVRQVTSDTRPRWHEGLLTGDPKVFVESLGGAHGGPAYYEQDIPTYFQRFMTRYPRYAPPNSPIPAVPTPPEDGGLVVPKPPGSGHGSDLATMLTVAALGAGGFLVYRMLTSK